MKEEHRFAYIQAIMILSLLVLLPVTGAIGFTIAEYYPMVERRLIVASAIVIDLGLLTLELIALNLPAELSLSRFFS